MFIKWILIKQRLISILLFQLHYNNLVKRGSVIRTTMQFRLVTSVCRRFAQLRELNFLTQQNILPSSDCIWLIRLVSIFGKEISPSISQGYCRADPRVSSQPMLKYVRKENQPIFLGQYVYSKRTKVNRHISARSSYSALFFLLFVFK